MAAPPRGAPPPPPPLRSPWASVPDGSLPAEQATADAALHQARLRQLEQELAAARDEASALHEMLEDLPEIFERKFRQRLQGVMEQQQRLLADNQSLRDRLYALQPAAPESEGAVLRLLPPASSSEPEAEVSRPPLREWVRGVIQRGREWMPGLSTPADDDDLSDPDDGRPTVA